MYRIVGSVLVLAVLCALFLVTQGSSPSPSPEATNSSAPSTDERALKSLNLN